MNDGHWMILFSGHRDVTLELAEAALRAYQQNWTVERRAWEYQGREMAYLVVREGGHEVNVALNSEETVLEESKEIAEAYASGRPDAAKIAAADRRFELGFELRVDMDNFNTVVFVQHALRDLLGRDCVTFMASAEQFIDE